MLPIISIHGIISIGWQRGTNMENVFAAFSYSKVNSKIEQLFPFISTIPDLIQWVPINHYLASVCQSSFISSHKSTEVAKITAQNY